MKTETVRTSAILIAEGDRTAVYRSLEEVPRRLRRKLVQSTAGSNAGTVLIADRRGVQELLRSNIRSMVEQRVESAPRLRELVRDDFRHVVLLLRTHWREFTAPVVIALLVWLALR